MNDFRRGHIEPFAAVELGLDYVWKHLDDDFRKLENSGIANAYLVHLVRDGVSDEFARVEEFALQNTRKVAYARVTREVIRCKPLGEQEIHTCAQPALIAG